MNYEDWVFVGIVTTITLLGIAQHYRLKKMYGDDDE